MKKLILALFCLALLTTAAFAENPNKDFNEDYTKLMSSHCVRTFVDGTNVGTDYVFAAKGSIHFIYLSGTMSDLIASSFDIPDMLKSANNDMGFGKRGYSNFIVYLVANMPWVVRAEEFNIGGYHLKEEDILTKKEWSPIGTNAELCDEWTFCIQVPNKYVKPGTEIMIGYGKDLEKFKIPTIK